MKSSFLLNVSGSYSLLPSMSIGCFMFFVKSVGVSFLNSVHSVTSMAASAFLRHAIADLAYSILFWKIVFAISVATGS